MNEMQTRRLTRGERFAALREVGAGHAAPVFKIGDVVMYDGRESRITDSTHHANGYVYRVTNYAGSFIIGDTHPALTAVE